MKKKILGIAVLSLALCMLFPIGSVFAAKPMDVSSTLVMDLMTSANTKVAGNNVFLDRTFIGSFTGGNFEGDVSREATLIINGKTNTPNPISPPASQVSITDQTFYVTNARVTVDGIVAVGEFEISANGKVGNVKWHISSSDMTIEGTDEPVKMHGNGMIEVVSYVPNPTPPPILTITNTIKGQVSFS